MDPNECLKQLLLALADEQDEGHEDALAYLEDLREWLEEGGAAPNVDDVVDSIYGQDEDAGEDEPSEELPPDEIDEVAAEALPVVEVPVTVPPPARRRTTVKS